MLEILDLPTPHATGVQILVSTRSSLISAGTERASIMSGEGSLVQKARRQPDKIHKALERARTDGIGAAVGAVRAKLHGRAALGYCSAGVVIQMGELVRGFAVGDRVVTNGPHGDHSRVAQTLAARIPDNVDFESAAFTPLAAIALQGVRLAGPTLGETVVVYGLGLVGLLTVQLLLANGCRVIGIDRDPLRLTLAERLGATTTDGGADPTRSVLGHTAGAGADAVLLTLATSSDDPLHYAAAMSRKRGRIVLVGVSGLALRREDFYQKELSFTVSCSYGPGRHESDYEESGHDYPLGFVRWTEQRNFEAVLHLMSTGALQIQPLITHRFEFEDAASAYAVVGGDEPSLGVLLQYAEPAAPAAPVRAVPLAGTARGSVTRRQPGTAAVIGAGGFAQHVLIPAIRSAGFQLRTLVSDGGVSAVTVGNQFGFVRAASRVEEALEDPEIDTLFIVTRHDSHGDLAVRGLQAGKNVFVEKPLALTLSDVDAVEEAAAQATTGLMVGFNRRFSPLAVDLRTALQNRAGPLSLVITVNAGAIPHTHWTQDLSRGGGRIAGEACHFIDLARSLVGASIRDGVSIVARDARGRPQDDIAHLALSFVDGSTAVINYLASGSSAYPKERIEAYCDGTVRVIDDWRTLQRYDGRAVVPRRRRQDKGHGAELAEWYRSVTKGGQAPIPKAELFEVSRWTLRLAAAARGNLDPSTDSADPTE